MSRLPIQQPGSNACRMVIPGASSYSGSAGSSPRVLQERGSLRTLSDGKSQFIGSSSGVYFVNTVRRAFSDANSRSTSTFQPTSHPSPEDCIVADDEDDTQSSRPQRGNGATANSLSYGPNIPLELGRPPPPDLAKNLFMTYFQTWHQFFPFLHGPTLLKDIELLYSVIDRHQPSQPRTPPLPLAKVVILQCLFNLASLHAEELPAASQIDKPADVLSFLPGLAVKSDIISIQALFAAQLLLVARMSLHTAAAVAGLLSRSIFLAGLHRCPVRYRELSAEDCDIRKRLFWSIYVIDRYLSQALGHPLGIQDSDVDVCSLSGPELHNSHFQQLAPLPANESRRGSTATLTSWIPPGRSSLSSRTHSRLNRDTSSSPSRNGDGLMAESPRPDIEPLSQKQDRHLVLSFQAEYARLLGRALELFHKSIHVRSMDPGSVLSLRTDVTAWWNSLPSSLQEFSSFPESNAYAKHGTSNSRRRDFSVSGFFVLLHSQLVLLINRPWLSLEPSSPEFHSALQTCIGVARETINILRKQRNAGHALFWPGYLSAAWMAGLILAFACHLQLYPAEKGYGEIMLCLEVLSAMSGRWRLARNCHTVLSDLQQTFETNKEGAENLPGGGSAATPKGRHPRCAPDPIPHVSEHPTDPTQPASKRRRIDSDMQPSQPGATYSIDLGLSSNENTNRLQPPMNQGSTSETNVPGVPVSITSAMRIPVDRNHPASLPRDQPDTVPSLDGSQQPFATASFQRSNDNAASEVMPGADSSATTEQMPTYGFGDDTSWMAESGALSNWDSGMPDVFAGATWESLLHVVSQDNLTWDDVFR